MFAACITTAVWLSVPTLDDGFPIPIPTCRCSLFFLFFLFCSCLLPVLACVVRTNGRREQIDRFFYKRPSAVSSRPSPPVCVSCPACLLIPGQTWRASDQSMERVARVRAESRHVVSPSLSVSVSFSSVTIPTVSSTRSPSCRAPPYRSAVAERYSAPAGPPGSDRSTASTRSAAPCSPSTPGSSCPSGYQGKCSPAS